MIADVDVFVQGYRYKSLDSKGLGLKDLLELAGKRKKGILYIDENAYGPDGPYAERPGWQQIGDSASGVCYVLGKALYGDGRSITSSLPISDMFTGLFAAMGAMMGLRDRARYGGFYH